LRLFFTVKAFIAGTVVLLHWRRTSKRCGIALAKRTIWVSIHVRFCVGSKKKIRGFWGVRRVSCSFRLEASDSSVTLVTWLILPVVICLSQRLSHASLSISICTVKLRKAHYISYSLFDGALTTWITVVILELIHAQKRRLREPWTY
jgi:hypothetical protein